MQSSLDLADLELTDDDLGRVMERVSGDTGIHGLDLTSNKITETGIVALTSTSPRQMMHLTQLRLTNNSIRDAGAAVLPQLFSGLLELHVEQCDLTSKGATLLLQHCPLLTYLNLSTNCIGDEGLRCLPSNRTLTKLIVSQCSLGPLAAKYIAEHVTLQEVDVSTNGLGAVGASELAKSKTIQILDLSQNDVKGGAGVFGHSSVQELQLFNNGIDSLTIRNLAESRTLRYLNLSFNRLDDECIAYLRNNIKTLTQLDVSHQIITRVE